MFNPEDYIELFTQGVVLNIESAPRFHFLLRGLLARFQPIDIAEYLCVPEMAWAKRRLCRVTA